VFPAPVAQEQPTQDAAFEPVIAIQPDVKEESEADFYSENESDFYSETAVAPVVENAETTTNYLDSAA
jgi:hypothetical protein